MAIFLTKDSKVVVQGITGSEATVHTARMLKAGTQIVGGVNARKAGTTVTHEDKGGRIIELPVFGTVVEAIEEDRRRRVDHLRAAEVRQGRDHRGDRRGDPAAGRHHRGNPGAGQRICVGLQRREGQQDPHHRSELPRHHHPGPVAGRHHAGQHQRARVRSGWCPSPAR